MMGSNCLDAKSVLSYNVIIRSKAPFVCIEKEPRRKGRKQYEMIIWAQFVNKLVEIVWPSWTVFIPKRRKSDACSQVLATLHD